VEMAASCDFRFCTPETEWGVPEINLGVIAGSGGSSRLTRLVGPSWGKYMAMAGMRVGAEQAKTIGLVQDVFPAESFMDDVYGFCRRMMTIPADALGMAKLAVDMAADVSDRNAQRHFDRVVNTVLVSSDEFEARTARFKSK
jgi:enoyl-CoA hydratase